MKKSTSKIHSHFIDKHKHSHFLAQNRQDSITHETIEEGDEVVFCSVCKSAFMVDSWQYIGRSHCHQSQTLKQVPVLRSLSLDKKKIEKRKKTEFYKKHSGAALTAICVLIGAFTLIGMAINGLTSPAKTSLQGISITEKHYINNGKKYYQAQNYTEAENYYLKALQLNPSNTEAIHLLSQLENEYLLALEEADRFFKLQNYDNAKAAYKKATLYKPNSEYPAKQLALITQAQAELPILFTKTEDLIKKTNIENYEYSILKEFPKEWEKFINQDEKLYFWVENRKEKEILLSYESGLVELRSLDFKPLHQQIDICILLPTIENGEWNYEKMENKTPIETNLNIGKILNTFKGSEFPQATFVYNESVLNKEKFEYESISVISKGNKIYYYTLDKRGARQVNEFSTFHFKADEKVILSDDGRYFLIQNKDKLLHLYDARNKTLLKSLRTNEHLPFIKNAYFNLENNQIIAITEMGESRWELANED